MSDFLKDLSAAPWEVVGESVPNIFSHCFLPLIYGPHEGGQLKVAKVGTDDVKRTPELGRKFLADAQFIALARNAFDIMLRREWGVHPFYVPKANMTQQLVWKVIGQGLDSVTNRNMPRIRDDPLTALLEADAWLKAQEQEANVETTPK